jgi:transcriptional regulator with XRE-family HTH domain
MASKAGPRRRTRPADANGPLHGLAEIVAERRLALALTQADLAALAGVGVAAVHKLENAQPTLLPVALRVLDALGLAVAVAPAPALPPDLLLPTATPRP